MDKETALTIDPVATRAKMKADERPVNAWSRLRGFPSGTVQRVISDTYPVTSDPSSMYQKILRALLEDGYLVQQGPVGRKAA